MVYSIDKLDGSIVSLCADIVNIKEVNDDFLITFNKIISLTYNENTNEAKDIKVRTVGAYYMANIVGFREVAGVTDQDLERMFKEDTISINENGEYCAKDGDDYEEIIT